MRTIKVFLVVLILAGLAVGLAWRMAPGALEHMARQQLEYHGFEVTGMQRLTLTGNRLSLQSISLLWPTRGLNLNLRGVDIGYSVGSLMQSAIESIRVDAMTIKMGDSDGAAMIPDPHALLSLDLSGLQGIFPVNGVQIDRIEIQGATANTLTLSLAGEAVKATSELNFVVNAINDPATLALTLSDDGAIRAVLGSRNENPEVMIELSASTSADKRYLTLSGNLQNLARWSRQMTGFRLPDHDCHLDARLRVTRNPLDSLSLSLNSDECRLDNMALHGLSVHTPLTRTASGYLGMVPSSIDLDSFKLDSVNFDNLKVEFFPELVVADESLAIQSMGNRIMLENLVASDLVLKRLRARHETTLSLWPVFEVGTIKAETGVARLADLAVQSADWQIDPGMPDDIAEYIIRSPALSVQFTDYAVDLSDLELALRQRDHGFEGQWTATLYGDAGLNGRFASHPDEGYADIELPALTLGSSLDQLSDIAGVWAWPADIVSGQFGARVNARWNRDTTTVEAVVSLIDAGGFFEDIFFSGLNTRMDLDLYPALASQQPAEVQIARTDAGVALERLTGALAFKASGQGLQLSLDELSAGMYGGRVLIDGIELVLGGPLDMTIPVTFQTLDLNQVAGNQQFPGLDMTGFISGVLPLRLDEHGISSAGGTLSSTEPGIISYDTGPVQDGSMSGAEVLFKALRRFEYNVLTVQPDYQPDGTLVLKVHLEGVSDEIGRDQPIHFNINVEQNVLSLFESLRVVNGLHEDIDARVTELYESRRQAGLQ